MNKAELKKYLKDLKTKQKEEKNRYKLQRSPFKVRVKKITDKIKAVVYGFIFDRYTSIHNFVNRRKMVIDELRVKVDYIVDSLKATLNTDDEIREKTIEDIVENIDNL